MKRTKYRIAFLCSSTSLGGLELNILRLACWMHDRGHEVFFLAVPGSPLAREAAGKSLSFIPIRRHRKYYDIAAAIALRRKLNEHNIRLLLIRDTRDISLSALTKTLSGNMLKIFYYQAMQLGVKKKDLLHSIRFSRIDVWLSLLQHLADEVRHKTRYPAGRIRIMPLGLETRRFAMGAYGKTELRKKLNLPLSGTMAIITGRLDPLKGQLDMIEALNILKKKNETAIKLLLLGDPTKNEGSEYAEMLKEKVHNYSLGEEVIFRPFSPNVEEYLGAADIFVLTSAKETFGTVTIEAMVAGLPVIATNSGGSPEILEKGRLGLLYTPGKAEELADRLMDILNNHKQATERAGRARKAAIERYSHDNVCSRLEEIIAELG